ncbi:MAG: putative quinol monooxygenase [Bacteroidota bacterium]
MSAEQVYLIVSWKVKPGHLDEVLSIIDEMGKETRNEPGNTLYHVHQSTEDPQQIYLYEAYLDEEAVESHKQSYHYQRLVAGKAISLLAEKEVIRVKPLSV